MNNGAPSIINFAEPLLAERLESLGYRIAWEGDGSVYACEGPWRPTCYAKSVAPGQVEHLAYFERDARNNFVGFIGVRYDAAERFSREFILKYQVNSINPLMRKDISGSPGIPCLLRVPLDRFSLDRGKIPNRMRASRMNAQLVDFICAIFTADVLPMTRQIETPESLLRVLISDESPWKWFATGSLFRVVQIFALAKQINGDVGPARRSFMGMDQLIATSWVAGRHNSVDSSNIVEQLVKLMEEAWCKQGQLG